MINKRPLDGLLEPASKPYGDAVQISIAISLKRIADALSGDGTNMAPLEYLADVIGRKHA